MDFHSAAANEFAVRATGGSRFISAIDAYGNPSSGVQLAPGSGSWSSLSDRAAKHQFAAIDSRYILRCVNALPIETWSYRSQDATIRHIDPTAQDFRAAFDLGEDDKHISVVDAEGVALASIQGLYRMILEKDSKIAGLNQEINQLKEANAAIERRVAALEQAIDKLNGK